MLGFLGDGVKELAVAGKKPSAVCFDLSGFLAEAELNSEPVDGREFLDFVVGGAERRETDFL